MRRLASTFARHWRLVPAALAVAALLGAAPARPRQTILPFIQDDYPKALERARAAGLPIFIESWAPW